MTTDPIETTSRSLQQLLIAITQTTQQITRIIETRQLRATTAPPPATPARRITNPEAKGRVR